MGASCAHHDSTPSLRTTVRRVFPDDPGIYQNRDLINPSAASPFALRSSAVLLKATFVSRASIKTYEIVCSIHLSLFLSSEKWNFFGASRKLYALFIANGRIAARDL